MSAPSVIHSNVWLDLKPAPINPKWILAGTPTACNLELSRSRDETAVTWLWDCTPGIFQWFYTEDETIHIVEGTVVLSDGQMPPRRIGPGDIVFFPAGSHAVWHVETKVRKVAFFRCPVPAPLGLVARLSRRIKIMLCDARLSRTPAVPIFAMEKTV